MTPLFATGTALTLSPQQVPLVIGGMGLLFLCSFFFSGTETALFSLQKLERHRLKSGGDLAERISTLLEDRTALITTLLIGNETVNILLATAGASLTATFAPGTLWLNVALLTPALVLFSEVTPKIIAFRFNLPWVRRVALPLELFFRLIWPLRLLITSIVQTLARLLRVVPQAESTGVDEDELLSLVEEAAESGDLHERERNIVESIFEFDDLTVGRVMTPRPDIFTLPLQTPWPQLLKSCQKARFSRVPIYDDDPENIIGVLLIKDLLPYRHSPPSQHQLRSLMLQPRFIPQSKPTNELLNELLKRRDHMYFAVDEHGTLVGLITLDDLLAELLDYETEDESGVISAQTGLFSFKAAIDVEDFIEETGINLPKGDYHTVGGFVFHRLGRLPEQGDTVLCDGVRFEITQMEGRRISIIQLSNFVPPQERR